VVQHRSSGVEGVIDCGTPGSDGTALAVYGSGMVQSGDIRSILEQTVGVYGTSPTCYLSARARIADFSVESFDAAIADRALVRIRAMRYSVYTFPVDMVAMAAAATKSIGRKPNSYRRRVEDRYEEIASSVEAALADGPLPTSEIREIVDPEHEFDDLFNVVIGMMAADFRLVRTSKTGSWRSDRFLYGRWSDWIPDVDPDAIDEVAARRELVERYVMAYGPVDVGDVKWWTGWTKAETLEATDSIDLSRSGSAVSLLKGTRLLPVWDVLMVAYRNRDRLLDPSFSALVYDRFGNATSVVLHDGRVVGQWDLGSDDSPLVIKVAPFSDWPGSLSDAVEHEARQIGALVNAESVTVVEVEEPTDLLDSSRNRFLAPLSKR